MGVEFLEKAAPSFRKGRDKMRQEMGTPDLFKAQPGMAPCLYAALINYGVHLEVGEIVGIRSENGEILLCRELDPIGRVDKPTMELREALGLSHNEGAAKIQVIHPLSKRAEIILCQM